MRFLLVGLLVSACILGFGVRLIAQSTHPSQVVDAHEQRWPWPSRVHSQSRLVAAFPTQLGFTLVFQEPSGTVRIARVDQSAQRAWTHTVTTFAPPQR